MLALATVCGVLILFTSVLWWLEGEAVRGLLDFAGVPAVMHHVPPQSPSWRPTSFTELGRGGPSFEVDTTYPQIAGTPAAIAVLALLWLILASGLRLPRVPLPIRVLGLLLAVLTAATIVYNAWVSPVPPHPINRVVIGWSQSGAIVAVVGAAIFAAAVFPLPGPLWIKFACLTALIMFSLLWNVLRMAVILATVQKLGSLPFLLLEYSTGVFVQFLYIVTFYSLALYGLSSRLVGFEAGAASR